MTIRECKTEEVDAILSLWRQADATPSVTDEAEKVLVAIAEACVLVAVVGEAIVGSVIGGFDGWRGNIYRLAVHPAYRRRGIGSMLVAEVERRLMQRGARRISALVERERSWATSFWQAIGYTVDAGMSRFVRNVEPPHI